MASKKRNSRRSSRSSRRRTLEKVAVKIESAAARWDSRADAADLCAVAAFVRHGNLNAAVDRAAELDTIVRDELPKSFFKLLKAEGLEW